MGIMSDEPLIDDSELDDFDWSAYEPQHLTRRGNIMTSYHRLMHTVALCVSAVLFKAASFVLGRAVHHNQRINTLRAKERARLFGYHTGNVIDPCSDFDPVHPDYTPYSEK